MVLLASMEKSGYRAVFQAIRGGLVLVGGFDVLLLV
jgi:hypothetical protein